MMDIAKCHGHDAAICCHCLRRTMPAGERQSWADWTPKTKNRQWCAGFIFDGEEKREG